MKWDTKLYDNKHGFVTKYGQGLLELLAPKPGERILDVGCGTGHLTYQIAQAGALASGLDASPEMIDTAHSAYPQIEFMLADAAEFSVANPYDAIFSNAALHWVHRAEEAVKCMSRALRTGGRFVVEFGGKGNVVQIYSALEQSIEELTGQKVKAANYFPSVGDYASLLEKHGIAVEMAMLFDRPTPLDEGEKGLENWIRMFRRPVIESLPLEMTTLVMDRIKLRLRGKLFHDGSWYADYRRLRIVGRKE